MHGKLELSPPDWVCINHFVFLHWEHPAFPSLAPVRLGHPLVELGWRWPIPPLQPPLWIAIGWSWAKAPGHSSPGPLLMFPRSAPSGSWKLRSLPPSSSQSGRRSFLPRSAALVGGILPMCESAHGVAVQPLYVFPLLHLLPPSEVFSPLGCVFCLGGCVIHVFRCPGFYTFLAY